MGVFDLFRKNKNIITDNGLNKIYYDNGKGTIKEQFSKIKGVIDGDYIEYNRNGTYRKKEYKNGEICLTADEQHEKNIREGINKKIQEQIDKLLILDNLISKINQIHLLIQMENLTIEIYTKWIKKKLSNRFDEEIIKFYLFSKRNFFIKDLLNSGDETRLIDEHFTNEINFFPKKRLVTKRRFEWYNYTVSEQILGNFLIDRLSGLKFESKKLIYGNGIDESIYYQESIFFGLDFNAYLLINEVLTKSEEKQKKYSVDKFMKETFKDEFVSENEEKIIEIAVNEIKSMCNINKKNQEEIVLSLN